MSYQAFTEQAVKFKNDTNIIQNSLIKNILDRIVFFFLQYAMLIRELKQFTSNAQYNAKIWLFITEFYSICAIHGNVCTGGIL